MYINLGMKYWKLSSSGRCISTDNSEIRGLSCYACALA
ncbi:hypothetical protein M0802_010996 [Mischocyttarus mexicanus]|nr:hypothetical protein M0802_010996 [Mischocyttarus mexicanus]